jgi:DNA-binding response OmpR family regulator
MKSARISVDHAGGYICQERGAIFMPKRILIAEDDVLTREMLTTFAEIHGYDATAVSDGFDLLDLAADEKFDLIITDLMMANLSGASAAEMLKSQGVTTPIIALTALSPEETRLVQDDFIKIYYKPCDFAELFEHVESLIGK